MSEAKWFSAWNFPNYEVSSDGRVRRAKNGREIKIWTDTSNYELVRIFYIDKKYTKRLGKFVWETFNQCECKETVDHIDKNTRNNNIENLRCIPLKEQYANKNPVTRNNKYNLTNDLRSEMLKKRNEGASISSLAKQYKVPYNYLRESFRRGTWDKFI